MPPPPPPPFFDLVPMSGCEKAKLHVAAAVYNLSSYRSMESPIMKALQYGSVDAELLLWFTKLMGGTGGGQPSVPTPLNMNDRERLLVQSLQLWREGRRSAAVEFAEKNVLERWPLDMLTLRIVCDAYIHMGAPQKYLDAVSRVQNAWATSPLVKNNEDAFVMGMLSFGLQETGKLSQARAIAERSLSTGTPDSWAIHAVVHSYHSEGNIVAGLKFLNKTSTTWHKAPLLGEHLWWHIGIFHQEANKPYRSLHIFDKHLIPLAMRTREKVPSTAFILCDAVALLWRAKMAGVDVKERAKVVCMGFRKGGHSQSRVWLFTACHVVLAALLADDDELLAASMDLLAKTGSNDEFEILARTTGYPLARALVAYCTKSYQEVTMLDITAIGGSAAQRDTFLLGLLDAVHLSSRNKEALEISRSRFLQSPMSSLARLVLYNVEKQNRQGILDRSLLIEPNPVTTLEKETEKQLLKSDLYSLVKRWTRFRGARL
eukprot:TRINITY_DN2627_c0_g2_i1.p1 TRINITY_DN2627_c0_g2~~TRINITY_DN2627_c0_g2_i1.p1  ORF type:complete len:517 (+),score=95.43 TRINITY_DN2627_c0_g2_i1:89-1552(+)